MRLSAEDRQLLNDMTHQRNLEVHESGADIIPEFRSLPSSRTESQGSLQPIQTLPIAKKYCFWIDGKQSDVTATCLRYLELLLRLVGDFDEHLSAIAQASFL